MGKTNETYTKRIILLKYYLKIWLTLKIILLDDQNEFEGQPKMFKKMLTF